MKAKKLTYIVIFLSLSWDCFSQEPVISAGLWHLTSLYGDIYLDGFYRGNKTTFNRSNEFHQSTNITGGLRLKTKSYLWDPKFLTLDINAAYSPETRREQFLTIPDRSEVRTIKKLDLRATFLKQKNITLNAFANFNQSFNNREYLTNLKSINKRWGGLLSYKNKVLPFSMSYGQNIWDQEEIASGRVFNMDQKNFLTRASKSFSDHDFHEISYAHNEYVRQQADLMPIENKIDEMFLRNTVYFDSKKKYNFRSVITHFNQQGNNNYKKFQANEFLSMKLPKNFSFIGNYQFYNILQETQKLIQNRVKATLKHQLYLSLSTNIYFEYYKLDHSVYNVSNNKAGIDIYYTKKIPIGRLSLSYRYNRHHQNMEAQNTFVNQINEEHNLSDGQIVIMNRPYISPATIVVTDITGTIIYQLDFDYILIERNDFIEIQRIPGGQIQNNETVYINYTAMQPGSYQYDANNNAFFANILLFGRLIELYFRVSTLYYSKLINVDHITLNKYTQTIVGGKVDVGFARAGVEYDNYNSNIIPYQRIRYFVNLQKTFYKRLICSLNGNMSNYKKTIDNINQQYADISGKIAYRFRLRTKVSLEAGYRNQQGDGIDLDLFTGRGEFITNYRQMTFKVGMDVYRRSHIGDKIIFNNVYGKIIRKFKL